MMLEENKCYSNKASSCYYFVYRVYSSDDVGVTALISIITKASNLVIEKPKTYTLEWKNLEKVSVYAPTP